MMPYVALLLLVAFLKYDIPVTTNDSQFTNFLQQLVTTPVPDQLVIPKLGSPLSYISSIRPIDQELLHELFIWRNYASASYKDDADQWSCEICLRPPLSATMLTMMVENPESSCRAVVTVNPKLRVINVAFRGTQGLRGFQADFTANLVPWPANQSRTHAHLGFTSTYSSIAPSVLKILGLYAQSFPDYAIVLVGHSLGGAQAAVMAVDLIYHHPEWISRLELYMFNPPRPGDHAMAQLILQKGIKAYRVINHKDKVSSMPPRKSGYSHVGKEVWIKSHDTTLLCDTNMANTENPRCSLFWPRRNPYRSPLEEHSDFWGVRM